MQHQSYMFMQFSDSFQLAIFFENELIILILFLLKLQLLKLYIRMLQKFVIGYNQMLNNNYNYCRLERVVKTLNGFL